jgi:hypothetical protein
MSEDDFTKTMAVISKYLKKHNSMFMGFVTNHPRLCGCGYQHKQYGSLHWRGWCKGFAIFTSATCYQTHYAISFTPTIPYGEGECDKVIISILRAAQYCQIAGDVTEKCHQRIELQYKFRDADPFILHGVVVAHIVCSTRFLVLDDMDRDPKLQQDIKKEKDDEWMDDMLMSDLGMSPVSILRAGSVANKYNLTERK